MINSCAGGTEQHMNVNKLNLNQFTGAGLRQRVRDRWHNFSTQCPGIPSCIQWCKELGWDLVSWMMWWIWYKPNMDNSLVWYQSARFNQNCLREGKVQGRGFLVWSKPWHCGQKVDLFPFVLSNMDFVFDFHWGFFFPIWIICWILILIISVQFVATPPLCCQLWWLWPIAWRVMHYGYIHRGNFF